MSSQILRMKTIAFRQFQRQYVSLGYYKPNARFAVKNISGKPITYSLRSASFHNESVIRASQPNLIYVQNPMIWLRNKLRLRLLRYTWDHDFEEKEFKRGATQVNICNIPRNLNEIYLLAKIRTLV